MPSYQISLTRHERAAGRFISMVRRALQRALAEEHAARGVTQSSIATALGVNRSVIHRQIMGLEDISLGRVGAIAEELGRAIEFSLEPRKASGNIASEGTIVTNNRTTTTLNPLIIKKYNGDARHEMPARASTTSLKVIPAAG